MGCNWKSKGGQGHLMQLCMIKIDLDVNIKAFSANDQEPEDTYNMGQKLGNSSRAILK